MKIRRFVISEAVSFHSSMGRAVRIFPSVVWNVWFNQVLSSMIAWYQAKINLSSLNLKCWKSRKL